jgi:hypothetical protein
MRTSTQDFQVELDSQDSNLTTTANWEVAGENLQPGTTARIDLQLGDGCPNGGRVQVPAGGALALDRRRPAS